MLSIKLFLSSCNYVVENVDPCSKFKENRLSQLGTGSLDYLLFLKLIPAAALPKVSSNILMARLFFSLKTSIPFSWAGLVIVYKCYNKNTIFISDIYCI